MSDKPMSPEEFAEKMAAIAKNSDKEKSHGDADELMCGVLKSLGYGDGIAVFNKMDRWCA